LAHRNFGRTSRAGVRTFLAYRSGTTGCASALEPFTMTVRVQYLILLRTNKYNKYSN
jgi:hypothetical protein